MEGMRIFIGTEPKTKIAECVLHYSIAKHTKQPFTFTPMVGPAWAQPRDLWKSTGFSFCRFMVPAHCKFKGRAIYLDADQVVLADIAELWRYPSRQARTGCAAWLTYQVDKFSPVVPVPQT